MLTGVESHNAATKQDLEVTKLELKQDIKQLDLKIETVKAELKRDIEGLKKDIVALKKDMVIIMGGYAVFILGTLATLAKLGLLTP